MGQICHRGCCPMQGLALVSGVSHHTLVFLPTGTPPVLETIRLSALAHVSRPRPGPRKYLSRRRGSVCDPCRGSKLSFWVRGHPLQPDGPLLHWCSQMFSSVLHNPFPRQLRAERMCGFSSNYGLSFSSRVQELKVLTAPVGPGGPQRLKEDRKHAWLHGQLRCPSGRTTVVLQRLFLTC